MTAIQLSKGFEALIDDADFARVMAGGPWHAANCGGKWYASHWYRRPDGSPAVIRLHTYLTGWDLVDHINGDGLDNRRANLRPATHSQNSGNAAMPTSNTSGYKGVGWYGRTRRWRAYITSDGRQAHLGYYDSPTQAALAYDAAAVAKWGPYARLNFPKEIPA